MLTSLPPAQRSKDRRNEDRELVAHAENTIRAVRGLQGLPVFCRFDDGTLSLHGHVNSFHAKQLAQTAAAEIPGVSRIKNQLEVVPRQ